MSELLSTRLEVKSDQLPSASAAITRATQLADTPFSDPFTPCCAKISAFCEASNGDSDPTPLYPHTL
eukprot:11759565-Heterocapsa_arctica.AAC.1